MLPAGECWGRVHPAVQPAGGEGAGLGEGRRAGRLARVARLHLAGLYLPGMVGILAQGCAVESITTAGLKLGVPTRSIMLPRMEQLCVCLLYHRLGQVPLLLATDQLAACYQPGLLARHPRPPLTVPVRPYLQSWPLKEILAINGRHAC